MHTTDDLTLRAPRLGDEIFSHTVLGVFNVTAIRELIATERGLFPVLPMPCTHGLALHIARNGVEPVRIGRLRQMQGPMTPALAIWRELSDDRAEVTIIDGNHRAALAHEAGAESFPAIIICHQLAEAWRLDRNPLEQLVMRDRETGALRIAR